ncbi:MAG: hypothetical protein IJJ28_02275, partial [Lentisphaeria bacterium]|nr:hypothetical protein [Lentisphaeria bacterium]
MSKSTAMFRFAAGGFCAVALIATTAAEEANKEKSFSAEVEVKTTVSASTESHPVAADFREKAE